MSMLFKTLCLCFTILFVACNRTAPNTEALMTPALQLEKLKLELESVPTVTRVQFASQCLDFAKKNCDSQTGFDTLLWITRSNRRITGFAEASDSAREFLIKNHKQRPETAIAVFEMSKSRSPKRIEILESLLNSENAILRGVAKYALGYALRRKKSDSVKATELLESVIDEHSQLTIKPFDKDISLKELAQRCLAEIRELQIGMMAPDIQGIDLDEVPFSLKEYRGKVVLLTFWADW